MKLIDEVNPAAQVDTSAVHRHRPFWLLYFWGLRTSVNAEDGHSRRTDELADAVSLRGSKARIKDRLSLWLDSPATTLNLIAFDPTLVPLMAELLL